MKKYIVLFAFLFGICYAQDEKLEEKVLGTYTFSEALTLDYESWDSLRYYSDFGPLYYDEYYIEKYIIKITKEETLFTDNNYFVSIYNKKKLIHKHYISEIDNRYNFEEAYDIRFGNTVLTLFMLDESAIIYYDYDMDDQDFKSIYVFKNQ